MIHILFLMVVWCSTLLHANNADDPIVIDSIESHNLITDDHKPTNHNELEHSEALHINQPTHLVFRRYYFIARLDKTISLLKEIMHSAPQKTMHRITRCNDMPTFSHKLLIESAYRIQQSKSLKPILVVWEDFSAYKSLEAEIVVGKDDLFVKEFSQQLFFITKSIIAATKPKTYRTIPHDYNDIRLGSAEYIIESLDALVDLAYMHDGVDAITTLTKRNSQDIKVHASTDEINLRFYHLQRLTPIIDLINKHSADIPAQNRSHQGSIEAGWAQMTQYRKIGDKEYVQNFCTLLFKVLKGYITHKPSVSSASLIESIDIEEILYSMDVIADELSNVSEVYNDQEKLSLKEWIIKRWWVPLQGLGTALLKILNYHYNGEKSD